MTKRLPILSDFPSWLKLTIIPPPDSAPQLTNVLILLHGLGDTLAPFANFGKQLALPETIAISVQGPTPLPFELGGFHFGDDIQFDSTTGQMEFDTGFSKIGSILKDDVIGSGLMQNCGFTARDIMLLGFGQGGMAALATASSTSEELGGIVSIGGALPVTSPTNKEIKSPVLLLGGSSSTLMTRSAVEKVRHEYQHVEYHKWDRAGDSMPRSRDEMLPIMRFFAKRLQSRRGVPEGSVELG